ncbi:MAG: anhydro-N-acetylmuramic acid kinase [Gammaproteobacteria bacterium]|nr:anhydro-N-acetylmuramic acid kinase [Gammaproteobacteria bacterium]
MKPYYIGVLSGTSADGVDAALVSIGKRDIQLIETLELGYPDDLRKAILNLLHGQSAPFEEVAILDNKLGHHFARACLELMSKAKVKAQEIRAIGSHGQTVRHQPTGDITYTIQIADPNRIAELTGVTTVADFRRRDIAAGGQGAPLVPAFHYALFYTDEKPRVVANIGGIANVTLLIPQEPVIGFDTGPGNTLIDAWSNQKRHIPYDAGGKWASIGTCHQGLLEQLLTMPFFQEKPPKSTGPEMFNIAWLEETLKKVFNNNTVLSDEDIQATLTELTAQSLCQALLQQNVPKSSELILTGGGAHNAYLRERIAAHWQGTVCRSDAYGISPDWVEAMAFAWLAHQTLEHQPGNLPAVTGAKRPCILGGIYLA